MRKKKKITKKEIYGIKVNQWLADWDDVRQKIGIIGTATNKKNKRKKRNKFTIKKYGRGRKRIEEYVINFAGSWYTG